MSKLFEPYSIGPLTFRNRFVRSATQDWLCEPDGGFPKPNWISTNSWQQAASALSSPATPMLPIHTDAPLCSKMAASMKSFLKDTSV